MTNEAHEKGIEAAVETLKTTIWRQSGPASRICHAGEVGEIIQAYLEASGQAVVPREPTETMVSATEDIVTHTYGGDYNGYMDGDVAKGVWLAMIAAAPQPFSTQHRR